MGSLGRAQRATAAFQHPGVLVSRGQLDLARRNALAGTQPWKAAYDAMRASSYAALSWSPKPRAIVECGSSSNPNYGCSDERGDAIAAYTHAPSNRAAQRCRDQRTVEGTAQASSSRPHPA